jgi:hypothetical protein
MENTRRDSGRAQEVGYALKYHRKPAAFPNQKPDLRRGCVKGLWSFHPWNVKMQMLTPYPTYPII